MGREVLGEGGIYVDQHLKTSLNNSQAMIIFLYGNGMLQIKVDVIASTDLTKMAWQNTLFLKCRLSL